MNHKPELRSETLTERRLKRQLRRFITIEMECEKQADALCRTSGNWSAYIDAKRLNFEVSMHRLYTSQRMTVRTPQERKLRHAYDQIIKVVTAMRRGFKGIDTSLSRLVNLSKKTLYQTRRDKEMTE